MSNYCLISKGISYSQIKPGQVEGPSNLYDSEATVAQVKEHDRVFEKLCPPGTPQSTEHH